MLYLLAGIPPVLGILLILFVLAVIWQAIAAVFGFWARHPIAINGPAFCGLVWLWFYFDSTWLAPVCCISALVLLPALIDGIRTGKARALAKHQWWTA